ncbi:hypothetical protein P152DRAFT_462372 [Eremomyces bilateralis CBS 781.70]|uniref:Nudix hydrolase domain-containing protein n=1 Tax=Eremomyces bilateralis CBS 781.70 TaxID=1392243 RepID=A0A6G1FSK0_9PEZI|nr:uncharacterized protein P152DRAFT_462372 [Eremomyces bilateralis CBS 781.70]KAF1808652.1 hypothetical protein P152DRAFT_462372 [Eremomyces bilateralis CBS 781.70]
MAASRHIFRDYPNPTFLESAGGVVFDPTRTKIIILYAIEQSEFVLPKGRRDIHESRAAAAMREVYEETGLQAEILPTCMETRATPSLAMFKANNQLVDDHDPRTVADVPNIPRRVEQCKEPFWLCVRGPNGMGLKLIWWYTCIVKDHRWGSFTVDRDGKMYETGSEYKYEVFMLDIDKAIETLTFQGDRDVVRKAVEIMDGNGSEGPEDKISMACL